MENVLAPLHLANVIYNESLPATLGMIINTLLIGLTLYVAYKYFKNEA